MSDKKPLPRCPTCGGTELLRIQYGFPTPEAEEAATRGEIVLGGCVIEPGAPRWECGACGKRFAT